MTRYAQLSAPDSEGVFTVETVIFSEKVPDPSLGDWVPCGNAGPGYTTGDRETFDPPSRRGAIFARLAEIDATTDQPRARRELALGKTATKLWVQALDAESDALRKELKNLAAKSG